MSWPTWSMLLLKVTDLHRNISSCPPTIDLARTLTHEPASSSRLSASGRVQIHVSDRRVCYVQRWHSTEDGNVTAVDAFLLIAQNTRPLPRPAQHSTMLWGSLATAVLGATAVAAAGAPSNIPEDMVDKVRTPPPRVLWLTCREIISAPTRCTFPTSTATCRIDGESFMTAAVECPPARTLQTVAA